MGLIHSYKDLVVWQKGLRLTKEVFILTSKFPQSELYGLTSQMRGAAVAIPSNIAEGFGRRSVNYSIQFYSIAFGSALELETQLIISKELSMARREYFKSSEDLLTEVSKMLNVMIAKMKDSRKEDSQLVSNI